MALPISSIEASLEGKLFQATGSFWTSVFKDPEQVRILLAAGLRHSLVGQFNQAVQNFAGDPELASLVRHTFVPFEQNDIIETGAQVYDDSRKDQVFGEYTDAPITYGDYRIRYWALPLKGIIPMLIQAEGRQLLLGSDFFIQAGRYVFFRQDPRELFPGGSYLVVRGLQMRYRPYVSFFTQTLTPGYDDLVVQYFRGFQTPKYLHLALAAVGGLGIIRKGGKLQAIIDTANNTAERIYVFPNEVVRVNYTHDSLVIGQEYAPLTVVGNVIQIEQAETGPSSWWRKIDWRGGLVLDPVVPGARSLPLPDTWTVAYNAGQDPGSTSGSKVHAQLRLGADFEQEQLFWNRVRVVETATGYYLNALLDLPEEVEDPTATTATTFAALVEATEEANALNLQLGLPLESPAVAALPSAKPVNALDTFFQSVLGPISMVLAFDLNRLPKQKEVFDFLSRELPVGGCPIIIGFVKDVIDDLDTFDSQLLSGETVALSTDTIISVVEDVDGAVLEDERAYILAQPPIT